MDGYDNDQPEMVASHVWCQLRMSDEMLNRVAARFHTLGEPHRLRILQLLIRGAKTVGEVVQALDGNQSNVSRHLQILYGAGIVRRRREGTSVVYSLKSANVFKLCELVNQNEISRAARDSSNSQRSQVSGRD